MSKVYFLWDYDWSEKKVRKILKTGDEYQKRWLTARIVSSASFKDVFDYLTLKEILQIWPKLKMRPQIKNAWEKAFKAWGYIPFRPKIFHGSFRSVIPKNQAPILIRQLSFDYAQDRGRFNVNLP